jgi:hypothetical protein
MDILDILRNSLQPRAVGHRIAKMAASTWGNNYRPLRYYGNRPSPPQGLMTDPILQIIRRISDIDLPYPLPITRIAFLGDIFHQFRLGDFFPLPMVKKHLNI